MCKWGTDTIVTLCKPRKISGRKKIPVDSCISNLVQALNNSDIETLSSCCGHGNIWGSIMLADGRELIIAPNRHSAKQFFDV